MLQVGINHAQELGIRPGTVLSVEGVVGVHNRRLAILNPVYELESVPGVS